MIYNIRITINRVEGAIVRTLGLIERRGFSVRSIDTGDTCDEKSMEMALVVESQERSVDVLTRQIGRLYDVTEVHLRPAHDQNSFQERLAC